MGFPAPPQKKYSFFAVGIKKKTFFLQLKGQVRDGNFHLCTHFCLVSGNALTCIWFPVQPFPRVLRFPSWKSTCLLQDPLEIPIFFQLIFAFPFFRMQFDTSELGVPLISGIAHCLKCKLLDTSKYNTYIQSFKKKIMITS